MPRTLVAAVITLCGLAHAKVPPAFVKMASGDGVALYQKDYPDQMPDLVLTINLTQAKILSLHGQVESLGKGQGVLGGDNPTFERRTLADYWEQTVAGEPKLFAMFNGQFFSTADNPTALAFAVKQQGTLLCDGYATTTEYLGQKKMFGFDVASSADISDFDVSLLTAENSATNIIVGLSEDADKKATNSVGRTFLGLKDSNNVLLYVSKKATQTEAVSALTKFGATSFMMLDGGESSQLIVEGKSYVTSTREIPHVLAVVRDVTPKDADGDGSYVPADCDDTNPSINPSAKELCDGLDNDCDKAIDEGFDVGETCEAGKGQCYKKGVFQCSANFEKECSVEADEPTDELCDGLDNDCDGDVDEGLGLGDYCEVKTGDCVATGNKVCADDGSVICTAASPETANEICDGQDNNCDGQVDEGFDVGQACTSGTAQCATEGYIACAGDGQAYCKAPEPDVEDERCDGLDNDCDGETDEDFELDKPCLAVFETCQVPGRTVCAPTGVNTICEPVSESCNDSGSDDDSRMPNTDGAPSTDPSSPGSGATTGELAKPAELSVQKDESSGCHTVRRKGSNTAPIGGLLILFLLMISGLRCLPGHDHKLGLND